MRFVSLKQLHFIVFATGDANAAELFVVSTTMNENMAKGKTRRLELDHPSHKQAVEKHAKVVTETSGN